MRKNVVSAFSLIECMVYLSCTTVTCMLIFTCMSSLYREYAHVKQEQSLHLYLQLVRDLVRRDLGGASNQSHDYDALQTIFKKYWIDQRGRRYSTWIGYQVTPKGFARYQGLYDPAAKNWSKRSVSYMPSCCQKLEYALEFDQHTKQVRCIIISYVVKRGDELCTFIDRCSVKNGVMV